MINRRYVKKCGVVLAAMVISASLLTGCAEKSRETIMENPAVADDENTYAMKFSRSTGFYDEDFELEITTDDENAVIYYTIDGSVPDENAEIYETPIKITDRTKEKNILSNIGGMNPSGDYLPDYKVDKGTVIRAAVKYEDGSWSEIQNATYFVGIDRESRYGTLPIVSLYTDSDNLFDYEKGIFVKGKVYDEWIKEDAGNKYLDGWQMTANYTQKGRDWEREAVFEYIPTEGESYMQNVGIRVSGAASRGANQKSIRVTARKDYGEKNIKYQLIPDNIRSDGNGEVEKYKSIVLRNGGNDNEFAKLREPYLQSLVSDRNFDTLEASPCVVFIDGEYWGLYALTEDYSDNYIQNNYGVDNENAIYLKRGEIEDGNEEDIDLYNEMFDFIVQNDMSDEKMYEKAKGMLDMQGFMEYLAFNIYIYNEDSFFKNNNWGMWRSRTVNSENPYEDGVWRMMSYDNDYSTGIYNDGGNYNTNNLKQELGSKITSSGSYRCPKDLLLSLMENEEFRNEFLLTLCDIRNIDFQKGNAVKKLYELKELYDMNVAESIKRFGPEWVVKWHDPQEYFDTEVSELATFINGRYDCFMKHISSAFDDDSLTGVTVCFEDVEDVYINKSRLDTSNDFSGSYFMSCPISITVPKEYSVTAVENSEITFESSNSDGSVTYTILLTGNALIEVSSK